ncbi:MAG TPA: hypothetical protein VF212_00105 [Longimicrobiales bacterium]
MGRSSRLAAAAAAFVVALGSGCQQEPSGEGPVFGEYAEERARSEEFRRQPARPAEQRLPGVQVIFDEGSMALARDTVEAGPQVLLFTNMSNSVTTRCSVSGAGRRWRTEELRPGSGVSISLVLDPGRYTIECPVRAREATDGDVRVVRAVLTVR